MGVPHEKGFKVVRRVGEQLPEKISTRGGLVVYASKLNCRIMLVLEFLPPVE